LEILFPANLLASAEKQNKKPEEAITKMYNKPGLNTKKITHPENTRGPSIG